MLLAEKMLTVYIYIISLYIHDMNGVLSDRSCRDISDRPCRDISVKESK